MRLDAEQLEVNDSKVPTVVGADQSLVDYFRDCCVYKDLFFFLSLRDVQVRYKQAFFGIAWALIRPFLNMLLFAVIFGKLASLPSHNVNYYLFALAGILPWQLFVNYVSESSSSVVNNSHLITKLYFPRVLIPLAGLLVNIIDFGVGLLFLVGLMIIAGYGHIWSLFLLAPFIILTVTLCVGVNFWLSALSVKYRDFRFIIPIFLQFGMFISPVAYDSNLIGQKWLWLYALNPMVGIINGFRWALFDIWTDDLAYSFIISTSICLIILWTGLLFFRKLEKNFADQI